MSGGSSQQTAQLDPALRDAYLQNVETSRGVAGELAPRQFARYNQDQARAIQQTREFANPNNAIFQGIGASFDVANRAANYQPQNVQAQQFGGAQVAPSAMAAQTGYNPATAQSASAGPAASAASQGSNAATFGGAQAGLGPAAAKSP